MTVDQAHLRIDLTNQGVRLGDDLIDGGFALALASDGGTGAEGIDLILPGGHWVNVSVAPGYARTSPWVLSAVERGVALRHRLHGDLPVTLPDTVRFRHQRTQGGFSCGEIGSVHGQWLVCAPIAAQDGVGLDRPRRFLGLPPVRPLTRRRWSVDDVVATAEAAWRHCGARTVHLEAGHLLAADGGASDLLPYVAALRRALPVLVSVSVLPPERPEDVLALYAGGVDAVSYHVLCADPDAAATLAPVRLRFVPHARTRAALRAAAAIFPRGAVSTDLLVGAEPLDQVEPAMQALAADGVVANLALFRPLPGAEDDAPHGDLVPSEPLLRLMDARRAILARHGLTGSRVRGFARVLSGMDRWDLRRTDRWYASLRRWIRVGREAA